MRCMPGAARRLTQIDFMLSVPRVNLETPERLIHFCFGRELAMSRLRQTAQDALSMR